MLQAYVVVKAFSARQLEREPLHLERFRIGDLLFALRTEDGYTVFCRFTEADTIDGPSFAISDEEFADLVRPN